MTEPIRVLHVFGALDSGGVSNFVMNAYRQLDRTQVQFDFAMTSGKTGLFDEQVQAMGGRIFYFDPARSLLDNLQYVLRKNGPFAAVHSHVFFYSGLVLRATKRAGVPVRIAHAHNAHTGESRGCLRLTYERGMQLLIRRYATLLLGCSEKACRYVFGDAAMRDARCHVLPDGINCDRFAFRAEVRSEMRAAYGLDGQFVVGHVGHFTAAKNHEKILRVFAALCRRRQDAALLLVGDGELEADVRRMAQELEIADRVVFAGAMQDVERTYQAMDVFLFPSRYEGFGMAVVEAQASGLACVASDVVPEETNASGRVTYLPLRAPDAAWAEAVLSAPARETDGRSAETVKALYDIQSVAQTLCAIYCREMGGCT